MGNKRPAEGRLARAHVLNLDAVALKYRLLRQSRKSVSAAMDMNLLRQRRYLALIQNDPVHLDRFHVTFSYHLGHSPQLRQLGVAHDRASVHCWLDARVDTREHTRHFQSRKKTSIDVASRPDSNSDARDP